MQWEANWTGDDKLRFEKKLLNKLPYRPLEPTIRLFG